MIILTPDKEILVFFIHILGQKKSELSQNFFQKMVEKGPFCQFCHF